MLDYDGLQVAWLGVALAHYLDLETGDILDLPLDASAPGEASRYLRIPTRTPDSEAEDRRLFAEKHAQLAPFAGNAMEFRRALSEDRLLERKFFNFKNDQAARAIEAWVKSEGLS
jgi:hypothetical protein